MLSRLNIKKVTALYDKRIFIRLRILYKSVEYPVFCFKCFLLGCFFAFNDYVLFSILVQKKFKTDKDSSRLLFLPLYFGIRHTFKLLQ